MYALTISLGEGTLVLGYVHEILDCVFTILQTCFQAMSRIMEDTRIHRRVTSSKDPYFFP
jgi:hypothetical protein